MKFDRRIFLGYLTLISITLWIPMGILAFYFAPYPVYVKLLSVVVLSFVGMLIVWFKEE